MKSTSTWDVWLLLICIQATTGYYHSPSRRNITYPNLSNDSYFGYSIAYQANIKRLIVGAPKADIMGNVYTISIDSDDIKLMDRPQILLDNSGTIHSNVSTHYNYLYGAMVKAGSNFIVTCAPKNAQILHSSTLSRTTIFGLCFEEVINSGVYRVTDNQKLRIGASAFRPYGWSMEITKKNQIILGAPALYNGNVKVITNHKYKEFEVIPVDYFFGYSLSSGNYFDEKSLTSMYYAIATPHGITGTGKVLFYNSKNIGKVVASIHDNSLGAMFGAALCTVKLGDRLDYLLVGSPTYADENTVDRGAAYLYICKNKEFPELTLHKTIESPSNSTVYFGYSIVNLGDLDGDFKDEVAIGAPFENEGRGAVYIYSGDGLIDPNKHGDQMLIQKLTPEPSDGIMSFGFSLTSIQDYDENGCNELAIGAPESNKVVVYRCFSYITIKLYAKFPNKVETQEPNPEDKLVFQSCFNVSFPNTIPKSTNIVEKIRIQVKVIHPDVWFWAGSGHKDKTSTKTYETPITRETDSHCTDIEVVVRKMRRSDTNELMSYSISASMVDDARKSKTFSGQRVLPSSQSTMLVVSEESLADCKGDNCEPILSLDFKPYMQNLYIVGSTYEGSFSFIVKNTGATAYTPCLLVEVTGAPLLRLPQGCTTDNRKNIKCNPIFLLKNGTDWNTGNITLDTRELTSQDNEITISYTLFSRCNNESSYVTAQKPKFILISDIKGINIERKSEPDDVVEIFSKSSRVRHVYTISNSGPTTWRGITIDFVLKKKQNVVTYENIIVETDDEKNVICEIIETETEDELGAICKNLDLKKDKKLKVIVPFVITPSESKSAIETYNVSTSLILHLKNDTKELSAVTQLLFKKSTVPLWIILTASLLGLILLILLAFALFSSGFLKRKKKRELSALKKSVYRQSMHRMSTSNSKRSTQGDNEELIEKKRKKITQEQEQSEENEIYVG